MKRILPFVILFTLSFAYSTQAQRSQSEKIEALKIAFLTERLQLTSSEAQQFWPVYQSYQNEVKGLRVDRKDGDILENEEKLLAIKKKYRPSFEKVIGADKTSRLYQAEKDFRTVLIKRLRNQRKN
ncbi:MAG TPA: hypothetical protein PLM81_00575 [Ginsengibacter sp.]|nr:hypothetical protein [Chitinophagaceae bacterium]HRN71588.1 hypothetical protein [Ginsengibacter sp.]HRP17819.1 hypothetical protein [Ginsengibacter sp.]HRP43173.1 hypothetical protein [Ginsengibacter sp.]